MWTGLILLSILIGSVFGQYYMYTPGTPAVFADWDQFGGMLYCTFVQPSGCDLPPYTDITLCSNDPDNVSITPSIDQSYRYGLASETNSIAVSCDTGNRPGTHMAITTDGTLPDIYNASINRVQYVKFNPSNPTPTILARCIEPNKMAGRIAYFKRMIWDTNVNGTAPSCNLDHYKELDLPHCDPNTFGVRCDGQTFFAEALVPTPKSTPPTPRTITPIIVSTSSSSSGKTPVDPKSANAHSLQESFFVALSNLVILLYLIVC